jgi:hypothetical protein
MARLAGLVTQVYAVMARHIKAAWVIQAVLLRAMHAVLG